MCCPTSWIITENYFLILFQNSNYASKVELFGMMSMKGMRICNFTLQEFTKMSLSRELNTGTG